MGTSIYIIILVLYIYSASILLFNEHINPLMPGGNKKTTHA